MVQEEVIDLDSINTHNHKLDPTKPLVLRLDGRSFSNFSKNLNRPFDIDFSAAMNHAALALMAEVGASVVYTQSDEITLAVMPNQKQEILFGGRIQKISSVLAGFCSIAFYKHLILARPELATFGPHFDCRVYSVDDIKSISDILIWRQKDCVRNSISMLARHHFSSKQMHGKNSNELIGMLAEQDVKWQELAPHFKFGSFYSRKEINLVGPHDEYTRTISQLFERKIKHISNISEVIRFGVEPLCV